jgi:hypothetical protein
MKYFEEIQKEDPRFFLRYTLDDEDHVENLFWVDSSARDVSSMYNDCISFETTFMINKYNMSCAPFIGINCFGQSIQLGCGFLRTECIVNFVWLFEVLLEAMNGLHPTNIIIDQDQAMRSSILIVFLKTVHIYYRFHIFQKV